MRKIFVLEARENIKELCQQMYEGIEYWTVPSDTPFEFPILGYDLVVSELPSFLKISEKPYVLDYFKVKRIYLINSQQINHFYINNQSDLKLL